MRVFDMTCEILAPKTWTIRWLRTVESRPALKLTAQEGLTCSLADAQHLIPARRVAG